MNKFVSVALLASIGLCIVAFVFELEFPSLSEGLYTLGGLGLAVFGIWSSVLLLKRK